MLNGEKGRKAEEQVESWRVKQKLPFPEIDRAERMKFEDALDYPPAGSADQSRKSGSSKDE